MTLPEKGRPTDSILADLDAMATDDVDWRSGRAFSLAYDAGDEVHDLAKEASSRFLSANALNPLAFPSLGRMQSEVVAAFAELLNGGPDAAGFMTSGGTESILLAVKAARNLAREKGNDRPEMVLPTTAHAAFSKAAAYFDVEARRVPVGGDFRADVDAMAAAITDRTAIIVASAPSYPQGVIDPVEAVGDLAAEAGSWFHVDACMGGVTLPFLERNGYPIKPFDFRVPAVTSMSVDLHKYGYAPKGASVIVHRDKEHRRYQTFTTDDWLGGFYGSSGILGTKGGGPIAGAWAVMQHLGLDGYERLTLDARGALERLVAGLRRIEGLKVLGDPDATLVAFTFEGADTFAVGRALWADGWYCDQQGPPPSLHCTVNAVHGPVIDDFVAAVERTVAEVRSTDAQAHALPYASAD